MTDPRPPSQQQLQEPVEHLEDFTSLPWCQKILADPAVTNIQRRVQPPPLTSSAPNTLFAKTLFRDDAVRAYLSLYKPGTSQSRAGYGDRDTVNDTLPNTPNLDNEGPIFACSLTNPPQSSKLEKLYSPTDPSAREALLLVSLAPGLDGGTNRLHGGITAALLDQVMGILISFAHTNTSATAELNVRYKRPVRTPAVVLLRARIVREVGRWVEVVGWMEGEEGEDGDGGAGKKRTRWIVFAEGRGGFVKSRDGRI